MPVKITFPGWDACEINVRALILNDHELPKTHPVNIDSIGCGKCVEHIHGRIPSFGNPRLLQVDQTRGFALEARKGNFRC